MINIKFKIHGHLYWYAGKKNELEIEIKPDTIENILEQIGIPIGEVSFITLDNKKVEFDYIPNDGEVLDIYPIVGGG